MVTTNFPVNEAKDLVKVPQIGFLGGEQGEEIARAIAEDYANFPVMQIGAIRGDHLVTCSSPFYDVGVQERLDSGIRIATPSDLEQAIKINALDFSGVCIDTGLVLRTNGNPNKYLARNLMEQVKRRNKKAKMPVMIPLCGLSLKKDQDLDYGLSFKLRDGAEVIYAPILNKLSGCWFGYDETIDFKKGIPKRFGAGKRRLWTGKSGLNRLCLDRDLNLDSGGGDLAVSVDYGRVILVSEGKGKF